jgi:hypothetical protein
METLSRRPDAGPLLRLSPMAGKVFPNWESFTLVLAKIKLVDLGTVSKSFAKRIPLRCGSPIGMSFRWPFCRKGDHRMTPRYRGPDPSGQILLSISVPSVAAYPPTDTKSERYSKSDHRKN